MAHQVSLGQGLMFANKIQHDAAIDIAGGPARRHLKIIQFKLAHEKYALNREITAQVATENIAADWQMQAA